MRIFLTVLLLVPAISFAADETFTLLDCNTSGGPDQQVTVKHTQDLQTLTDRYTLIELSRSGRQTTRDLPKEEWESRKLQLQDTEFGDKSELYQVQDGWYLHTVGPGYNFSGYADCWDSTSHDG